MAVTNIKFGCRIRRIIVFLLLSVLFCMIFTWKVMAGEALLKKIIFSDKSNSLKLVFTEKIPFKVIKIGGREILIALKNVKTNHNSLIYGKKGSIVKNITIEHLQGHVLALIVNCTRNPGSAESSWNRLHPVLTIRFGNKKRVDKNIKNKTRAFVNVRKKNIKSINQNKKTVKNKADRTKKIKQTSLPLKIAPAPRKFLSVSAIGEIYIPRKRKKSIYSGDVSDLLIKADVSGCSSDILIQSVNFLKAQLYQKGFNVLNDYIKKRGGTCYEQAFFLRAFAFMRYAGRNDSRRLMRAADFFQEALIDFPDSKLTPFAFTSLGLIHSYLGNSALAEGFFNIVVNDYGNYPGMPEVLYFLGKIYGDQGFHEKALAYYKRVFEDLPFNTYTMDAGIGVGKELFREKQYINSLKILSYIVKKNPEKIYKSSELLLIMGNANFELGRSKEARKKLTRALNIFPDAGSKDMILTRIGETYAMEKNFDRAERVFRFVMAKYPGGEGYIASAMELAKYLKDRFEKEKIYNMIKKEFSDNKMAGVAMMRLAELYNQYGEYEKCIKEIENLLSTHPRGLRYDAVKLMQKAYESFFDKQLKSGNYPEILNKYEKQQGLIDRLDSRKIALSVGLAYGKAHLNDQAFNQLIKAYKLYTRSSRPPELLFGLGVVMDDSGRKDDALKILKGFTMRFPDNTNAVEAWQRRGDIFLEKNEPARALDNFAMAYKKSKKHLQKGKILEKEAEAYKSLKNWEKVSIMYKKALNDFNLASGTNYEVISSAYRSLGESYMNQRQYVNAGDAFSMAIKFSGENSSNPDLGFMMGDAYEKANIIKKAKQAFEKVAAGDDSIWSRLAKERLLTLKLALEVKKS